MVSLSRVATYFLLALTMPPISAAVQTIRLTPTGELLNNPPVLASGDVVRISLENPEQRKLRLQFRLVDDIQQPMGYVAGGTTVDCPVAPVCVGPPEPKNATIQKHHQMLLYSVLD